MPDYIANKAAEDELVDIHRGLQMAMDQLINERDHAEAERIVRVVDERMSNLINQLRRT